MNDIEFAYYSDVGSVRHSNEDSVLCDDNVCVVADGLGSRYHGGDASKHAINVIFDKTRGGAKLVSAIAAAHQYIANKDINGFDMGTTVVACEISETGYQVAWVGDSRAYLWNAQQASLTQLTDDHSLVNLWVQRGDLHPDFAEQHPQRNILTQCLGLSDYKTLRIDVVSGAFSHQNIMLLCSDGLTKMVSDRVIASILLQNQSLEQLAQELVTKANDLGGIDNVSVALARLKS